MPRTIYSEIYLVGFETEEIHTLKLPNNKEVLCSLFYKINTLKQSVPQSLADTINEVLVFWNEAQLLTRRKDHCIIKLKKLHDEWTKISKNRSRKLSPTQKKKENLFLVKLKNLFDITHQDAIQKSTINQKQFLESQRGDKRRGFFHVDSEVEKVEEKDEIESDNNNNNSELNTARDDGGKTILETRIALLFFLIDLFFIFFYTFFIFYIAKIL